MTIYTRGGDNGETSLCGGVRVAKDQLRIHLCGGIDELSAVLGIVRAEGLPPQQASMVFRIQQELIEFGTEVADPSCTERINQAHVEKLEKEIDAMEATLPPLTDFVIPGANKTSAFLHLARTVCRRAERNLVTLTRAAPDVFPTLLIYLNRLSDWLFVIARVVDSGQWTVDSGQ